MRRILCGMVVLLLALPPLQADDKPDEKKPATPKEQYDALMKDFATKQRQLISEIQKAKGEERQKLVQKYFATGEEFAGKMYKIAEENPKDPVAVDAVFWVVQNGGNSPSRKPAQEKVVALVGELPLNELMRRLNMMQGASGELTQAAFKRAQKDDKDAQAANLLAWVVRQAAATEVGQKAVDELLEKHIESPAIEQVCANLGFAMRQEDRGGALSAVQALLGGGNKRKPGDTLKQILEKSSQPRAKAAAALALGQALAAKSDQLSSNPMESDKVAAEAEKYLAMIDGLGKDLPDRIKKTAAHELKALQTLRIGKTAPEINGPDLDEKPFKLSDYRGKVVLLDFWGNW